MKNTGMLLRLILFVVSCGNHEVNCETRKLDSISTSSGNVCVSKELKTSDLDSILSQLNLDEDFYVLSLRLEQDSRVAVYTSESRKLSFNNGKSYFFEKQNGLWTASGEGAWIAD